MISDIMGRSFFIIGLTTTLVVFSTGCDNPSAENGAIVDAGAAYAQVYTSEEQQLLLEAWDLSEYEEDKDDFVRSASFDRYFEPVGIIALSDSVLIGYIESFDVDNHGNMLLADRRSQEVTLYDPRGRIMQILETEKCHPGYQLKPREAHFDRDRRILVVSNTSPSGFFFDSDGSCNKAVDLYSWNPDGVVADLGDKIYVYESRPDKYETYSVDSPGVKKILFEDTPFSLLNSRVKGLNSVVSIGRRHLALVQRQSPLVKLISIETGKMIEVGKQPSYYRKIERDLKEGLQSSDEIFRDIRLISDGKSQTVGIFALSKSVLILFHLNSYETFLTSQRGLGLQIVHMSGRVLNSEPILMRGYMTHFIGATRGFLFREASSYESGSDLDSNRPIVVYRYKGEL